MEPESASRRRLAEGESAQISRVLTTETIDAFARLTGDTNPLHLDEAFARSTPFGGRIGHGMWTASLISAVLGTELPGPGAIYLSQSLRFLAPVRPGDRVTARVTVRRARPQRGIYVLETVCTNDAGERVLEGEAVVRYGGEAAGGG